MMRRAAGLIAALLLGTTAVQAQETPSLSISDISLVQQTDVYGQIQWFAEGTIINDGSDAYVNVILNASALDEDGELIGEGIGYLVDACGAGLLVDFVHIPSHEQEFLIPIELYELDAAIGRVDVVPSADVAAIPRETVSLEPGIRRITDREIVSVRWIDSRNLQYAVGCQRDLASDWDWHALNAVSSADLALLNPYAPLITDELRQRLSLTDPLLFANSRLSFAPGGTRLVYQDAVNRFYTAATDGRLQRQIFGALNSRQLQEVEWLADDRFIARYYGAYGDAVLYFTATAEGIAISPSPRSVPPSIIRPGATRDGRRVILSGTFDDENGDPITGYFITVVTNGFFEPLFTGDSPGINYPPPVPVVNPETDLVERIYVVRDISTGPSLQCFNRATGELTDLARLPLDLADGDTSGLWISPDERTLALSATGASSGLWLIDLEAFKDC